jgi:penicillin-binding protein 1C
MPDERDVNPQDEPTIRKFTGEFTEPPIDDDDTADLILPEEPEEDLDVPFKLPMVSDLPIQDNRIEQRRQTMPHDPNTVDPHLTLPGSGGLDPNPDMAKFEPTLRQNATGATLPYPSAEPTMPAQKAVSGYEPTVPNPAPSGTYEPTVMHQRAVPPSGSPAPGSEFTMPNPQVADDRRYQRPAQPAPVQQAMGQYVPPPPIPQQKQLPRRRTRARILGFNAGCVWIFLGLFVTFCGGLTLLTGTAAAIFIPRIEDQWTAQIARVDDYKSFESSFFYDRQGNVLYEAFGEGRRVRVPYTRFPQHLINATISIEDDSFFENIGVDVGATFVAFLNYLGAEAGERTAGGSTITQQVVRNVLFDFEKRTEISVQRKAEEIILAVLLTNRRSKEDILEMYLNEIYYGNLAYGAQTAAQTLFGKDVSELTLGEAALLAGLPQTPAELDPLNPNPEIQARVYARQRQVLQEMVEEGYITSQERDAALSQGLSFVTPTVSLKAPHFTVYAQSELTRLMENLGYTPEDITRGGWRVYTTIDQNVNNLAQQAAAQQVANLANKNVSNAAVIVLKPLTGEILGMVGSIDYNSETIDGRVNVTIALRQPGSTMKPFTYSAGIERGMTPGDVIWDTRTDIGIPGQPMYTPRNYDGAFHGPVIMRSALANSYNIPAVQTLRLVGVDYLLDLMKRFGVTTFQDDPSLYGLSLTLGGGEISLLELTAAYGVFANQGAYVLPTSILCVINSDDEIVYQYENGCPSNVGRITPNTVERTGFGKQVLDPRIAYLMTDILNDNRARTPAMGSNSPLLTQGIESSVKTGTTNDVKDNWTIGYTRNMAVGVWVGNNDGTPMVGSSGLTGAAPIWNSVLSGIYRDPLLLNSFAVGGQLLPDKPQPPAGMSRVEICDVRRVSDPSSGCPATVTEWLLDGVAGIPDGDGNLQFPPQVVNEPPQSGYVQEISPDVYRALVFPIPDAIAGGITYQLSPGDKTPPPPRYCRITPDLANANGAQELVFVAGPVTSQGDLVEAEKYARANGIAILPTIDCWQELLTAAPAPGITTAIITSPTNGQWVTGPMPIMGTAQFDPSVADFYQFFLMGGQYSDWIPLGGSGYSPIVDGELAMLTIDGLMPASTYQLRLALFQGNNMIQQYDITFNVP